MKHQPDWDGNFDLAATNLVRALLSWAPASVTIYERLANGLPSRSAALQRRLLPAASCSTLPRGVISLLTPPLAVYRRLTAAARSTPHSAVSIPQRRRGWHG